MLVHYVQFVSGNVGGEHVIVPVGALVYVSVRLSSTVPVTGGLHIEVTKDIAVGPDEIKKLCFFSVTLGVDLFDIGPCAFVADEFTIGPLRQYFVRLYWNDTLIYSPVDPETREYVMTRQVETPTPAP